MLETGPHCSQHALDSQEAKLLAWNDAIVISQGRLLLGSGDQELSQLLLVPAFPIAVCLVLHLTQNNKWEGFLSLRLLIYLSDFFLRNESDNFGETLDEVGGNTESRASDHCYQCSLSVLV